jgi:hypothetical protein
MRVEDGSETDEFWAALGGKSTFFYYFRVNFFQCQRQLVEGGSETDAFWAALGDKSAVSFCVCVPKRPAETRPLHLIYYGYST